MGSSGGDFRLKNPCLSVKQMIESVDKLLDLILERAPEVFLFSDTVLRRASFDFLLLSLQLLTL